jgi:glycosyltransferase involved in cell wall biosynthesis
VRQNNLSTEVMFLGKQEVIEHILPMGDVFLMPSESESFGLAALEAMASGLPVVGTCAGGLPELVENGQSGYLSPIGDVEGMAAGVLKILESSQSLTHFSEAARNRALQFDVKHIVPRYEALYHKVFEERGCKPKA